MKRFWAMLVVPFGAVGLLTGLSLAHPSSVLAPAVETPYSRPPQLPTYSSLDELYDIRDRLRQQFQNPKSIPASSAKLSRGELLQALQAVEIRVGIEETAIHLVNQSVQAAKEAAQLEQTADRSSLQDLEQIYDLWQTAVQSLEQVPKVSLATRLVPEKLQDYQAGLEAARHDYDTARSEFLRAIAQRTGLPTSDVHITVCQETGECRRWNGDVLPASPASLIKLPIAIALMEKLAEENISLDTPITVSPGNYTEDASDIAIGETYSLRKLMTRMINQSSNIATNQLIDYVGRSTINQVIKERGYQNTFVDYKLVGEYTYPDDAGSQANTSTTDDMADMIRRIYQREQPGDEALLEALSSQEDRVLGHDGLRGTSAKWLGEKTGQNSESLGTVYAFKVGEQLYFASIILDYSGDEAAIRRCVNEIAQHISRNGGL